jgi:hypothetical protein
MGFDPIIFRVTSVSELCSLGTLRLRQQATFLTSLHVRVREA